MRYFIMIAALAALLTSCSGNKNRNMNQNSANAIETIMTRTSIREYTPEKLTDAEIETLLKAGMAAPSACNLQPWRFVVVTDNKVKQAISDNIQPAGPAAKAPAVIVVCGDMESTFAPAPNYWIEDCSAVAENILLAAHAMNLGAVWLGVYPQTDRCDFLKNLLGLPATIKAFGMIAVGHPAENPAPKEKWDAGKVHFDKW